MIGESKKTQSIIPGKLSSVRVVNGELHAALRVWKKQLKESRLIEQIMSRKHYEKPSVTAKQMRDAAKYKQERESWRSSQM